MTTDGTHADSEKKSDNSGGSSSSNGGDPTAQPNPTHPTATNSANSSTLKTDKPRPHVCGTCGRPFARLEHLKRHERSHTKEKPFECPECTRCFARRDLLLRHQQKLHLTNTTSSRPRGGRRDTTTGTPGNGNGRVRKNSMVNMNGAAGTPLSRPRANTIAHVDGAALGLLSAANAQAERARAFGSAHSHHLSIGGFPGLGGFDLAGLNTAMGHHANSQGPLRLDTSGLGIDGGGALRTAPPLWGNGHGFGVDQLFSPGSTVNPAQLHFNDGAGLPQSPFGPQFSNFSNPDALGMADNKGDFDWSREFDRQISFIATQDQAIEGSSPSAISTTSQSGVSEVMLDGSNNLGPAPSALWAHSSLTPAMAASAPFSFDPSASVFHDGMPIADNSIPPIFQDRNGALDNYFPNDPLAALGSPLSAVAGTAVQSSSAPLMRSSDRTSISSSITGSARNSSVTSVSTDSISDATRHSLLLSLSQSHNLGRKSSQPPLNSPISPAFANKLGSQHLQLPSTADLQRFANAYINHFHPHFPFLHLPTFSFNSPSLSQSFDVSANGDGGRAGCLVLAIAAVGALYEMDVPTAMELWKAANKLIRLYLEERRISEKARSNQDPAKTIPLSLVQAMMLCVIFGHQCGDRIAGETASNLCGTLVSLARSAELMKPATEFYLIQTLSQNFNNYANGDVNSPIKSEDPKSANAPPDSSEDQLDWHRWKIAEERKRTLFAVFILSSLAVSAFNLSPSITNSEIQLDLPCEEELWQAESAHAWRACGGMAAAAASKVTNFAVGLAHLLNASHRAPFQRSHTLSYHQPFGSGFPLDQLPSSDLKPSAFGCLVLINALHNYIWETRQRHNGREWTVQETESMHAHIEPALKAWQAAWASDPQHSLQRPNPFGKGPLAADSIPLLDLAYVRLFVNLGRSKEAFWRRDFDLMAEEIARGAEIVQNRDKSLSGSPMEQQEFSDGTDVSAFDACGNGGRMDFGSRASPQQLNGSQNISHVQQGLGSRRERYLRRAAFYAADSLSMSDKLGTTYADFSARELPFQAAMCVFDCAQVLAEWVSTVQERVGQFLGVLGRDPVAYDQVPCIMLLEDEDWKLLTKISDIVTHAEMKLNYEYGGFSGLPSLGQYGYGSKVLLITAHMLDKAAVWPGK